MSGDLGDRASRGAGAGIFGGGESRGAEAGLGRRGDAGLERRGDLGSVSEVSDRVQWVVRRTLPEAPFTFEALEALQVDFKQKLLSGEISQDQVMVILAEVEPTVTLGRHIDLEKLGDLSRFERAGVALHRLDRGGFETYHGPGQWVLYLVGRLDTWTGSTRGVRRFVDGLLNIGVTAAAAVGVPLISEDGCRLGLWSLSLDGIGSASSKKNDALDGGRSISVSTRDSVKVGSLGISIRQGVVQHGIALNVFRTPSSFYGISPCGLGAAPGFLWDLAGRKDLAIKDAGISGGLPTCVEPRDSTACEAFFCGVGEALMRAAQKEFRVLDGA